MKMGQEGIVGQLTGSMVWQNQGVMRLHGSTSLYAHPNSFAGMALGTIPFIIYLFPIVPKYLRAVFIIQLIFAFNIVLHSGSRTGYVGFLIMLFFMIYRSKIKKKAIFLTICLIISIVPLIDDQYANRFMTIFTGHEIEGGSMDSRKIILKDAIVVFIKHPFGVGVGAFPEVRYEMFGRTQDTHNLYLEVATNLGIQGLISFAIFITIMIKTLQKCINSATAQKREIQILLQKTNLKSEDLRIIKDHKIDLDLIEASSKAVALFLIVRLSLGMFGMDLYEIYWWFSLGLVVSLQNILKYCCKKTHKIISFKHKSIYYINYKNININ
jgi:O-antigen ligase